MAILSAVGLQDWIVTTTTPRYSVACAHGRFQPLHNGHLEYLLAAKRQCRFLWIGITAVEQPDAERARGTARERRENNPLSYYERVSILDVALRDIGVARDEFGFVPFPIEFPDRIANFVPPSVPCLTTICEEWNRIKIGTLRGLGYEVVVLYERANKEITGKFIRDDILLGGTEWRAKVPRATIEAVERLNVRARLTELRGT